MKNLLKENNGKYSHKRLISIVCLLMFIIYNGLHFFNALIIDQTVYLTLSALILGQSGLTLLNNKKPNNTNPTSDEGLF